jgi:hypothetical protein
MYTGATLPGAFNPDGEPTKRWTGTRMLKASRKSSESFQEVEMER